MTFSQLTRLITETPDTVKNRRSGSDNYYDYAYAYGGEDRPKTFLIIKDCLLYVNYYDNNSLIYTHTDMFERLGMVLTNPEVKLFMNIIGTLPSNEVLQQYYDKFKELDNPRTAADISGRLWLNANGPHSKIISFWNKKSEFTRHHMNLITKLIDKLVEDPEEFMFEFIDFNDAPLIPYDEVFGEQESTTDQKTINKLKADAHFIPGMSKKWANAIRNL